MELNQNNENMMPKRNVPRDVFLHLFAMVSLYWSSIAFITLCWQFIGYFLPDVAIDRYGLAISAGAIRVSVASLIIIFPLFILTSWVLNRIYQKESAARESKIRKWLIYLTLFIAALIIIGDLVTVIYNFLGGDVTLKFILKSASVLVVAGAVFGYYLDDVRRPSPSKAARYFAWGSGAIVLALVVGAFFIIGSPASARLAQLDEQRVSDLQNIQWQVVNYWQRKGQLPQNLADINDPISSYIVPNDPATNNPYEYIIKDAGGLKFELCATFSLADNGQSIKVNPEPVGYSSGPTPTWTHGMGRTCFERTIDKDLYPPYSVKGK